jgi:hypothetical protein
MLGEKLGDEQGQVTSRRVLPGGDYRYIRMEISFESTLNLLGKEGQNIGTYTVFERVPGQIYGEGQGICMFSDGSSAIWNGHGVGQGAEDGGISLAASVAFQAGPGLERLNGVLCLVEHHAHADGHVHSDLYEWKGGAH